jgi:hypothetical protein
MRAYVATTGAMFALIVVAHIARLAVEGRHAFHSPVFIVASLLSVGILVWSVLIYLRLDRGDAD